MDKRITRFNHCNSRFYPYLEEVLARLPEEVREDVLNNKSLQIVADEDFNEKCVLCYQFDYPVKNLVYLNIEDLNDPNHQLIHTIAHGIARYVIGEAKADFDEKEVERLLVNWGFEKEVEADRYDQAIVESESYRIGYERARKQDKEYLLQHFGLYFDEWNEHGLRKMSSEKYEMLHDQIDTLSIRADTVESKKDDYVEPEKDKISETYSLGEEIITGIMVALKEIKLYDSSREKN